MRDLDARDRWTAYQRAYSEVISRTSTRIAPWYVVPADHKWHARLAVQEILVRTLEDIDPQWPEADFDVDAAKARLAAQPPGGRCLRTETNRSSRGPPPPGTASGSTIVLEPLGPIEA